MIVADVSLVPMLIVESNYTFRPNTDENVIIDYNKTKNKIPLFFGDGTTGNDKSNMIVTSLQPISLDPSRLRSTA